MPVTRRDFLNSTMTTALWAFAGCSRQRQSPEGSAELLSGSTARVDALAPPPLEAPLLLDDQGRLVGTDRLDPFHDWEFVRGLPFSGELYSYRPGERAAAGLDGRMTLELSHLQSPVTATDEFFIRSFRPDGLTSVDNWSLHIDGQVEKDETISLDSMREHIEPQGPVLIECAGNGAPVNFGLMSVAEWAGISIGRLFEMIALDADADHVRIEGFDEHSQASSHSQSGASWIFPIQRLIDAGAFLATEMNGEPLTDDHGFPVRLVVPGWYGCCCIKWVTRLTFGTDRFYVTPHMEEFGTRTHQELVLGRVSDFKPAVVDRTAMPIRVEQWRQGEKTAYRVVGITWGIGQTDQPLQIRFWTGVDKPGPPGINEDRKPRFGPIDNAPSLAEPAIAWQFWSHMWTPTERDVYTIECQVADPALRTIRLDRGFYNRRVEIA